MNLPPVLTVKELAAYLRIAPCTVYRMCKKGTIPAFRVGARQGGDWRFRIDEIQRWQEKRR